METPKQLTSGNQGQTHTPVLSPSGIWAAWLELAEDGYESDRARLVLAHVESGARKVLTELDKWNRSPSAITWDREETALWMSVGDVGYVRVYRLDLPGDADLKAFISGEPGKWVPTPVQYTQKGAVTALAALPRNRLLYALSSLTGPNELYLLMGKDRGKRLTDFSGPYFTGKSNLRLDPGESYWFEGAKKGHKIQGWIHKPHGYEESKSSSKKWPAVL